MERIVIGTRASELARTQTEWAAEHLRARGHEVELELISTRGDRERGATIPELGGKGLFTAELEHALREGDIHCAVHSLKDLPTEDSDGLVVAAIPPREDHADALVSAGRRPFADLPEGARVGTASLRRRAMLLCARPDLDVRPLRGNVGTRVAKTRNGELDAVVLAAAGLRRLGMEEWIADRLDFLPAPAQGALAVQVRDGDPGLVAAIREALHDETTDACTRAERELLHVLEGGCSVPIGALAVRESSGGLHLRACVAALDGSRMLEADGRGADPVRLGREVAQRLRELGAQEILDAATG